jgi:CO/xanthine dehydrogenase Mo-binding subunit
MFCATGIYEIPHVRVNGKVLKTHTVPNGAFRGFGAPQAFFAVETHFNHCAAAAGEDILSFKAKHMLKKGSPTSTGGSINEDVLMPEIIKKAELMSRYREKRSNGGREVSGKRYGIGWSLFFHGCGFTGSGERDKIKAKVRLHRRSDMKTEILISSTEMGQGPQTTLRKVVARILNIAPEQVIYDNPDTDRVPDSGPTVASRTAMIVGYLVQQAAVKLRDRWAEPGEIEVETNYTQPPHVTWDQDTFQGDAYPAYSWGVNVAEVEVDPATLEIAITGFYGVYDVGVALDESIVRGQLEGGIAQGIGLATIEVMEQSGGRLMQKTMTDYMIPTSKDLSRIDIELIDNPYSYGAFGAKSTGELPLVGAIPAVVAAVENALDRRLYQVPLKPEYLQKVCCDED